MTVTNSQLANQITTLLQQWNAREAELRDWMAGAPDGGANGDGKFPLTDASGRSYMAPSLLKLIDTVEGPAALSVDAQLLSEAARDAAISARDSALSYADGATAARDAAIAARDLAQTYSLNAAADAANLDTVLAIATDARDEAVLANDGAQIAALSAQDDADAAAISAANAAQFDLSSQKGQPNGLATLNSAGQIPNSQIPAVALVDTYEVSSQAAQLGLVVQQGDVCVRSDLNKSFIRKQGSATGTMADWQELRTPTDAVLSVNGRVGAVDLTDLFAPFNHSHAYLPLAGGAVTGNLSVSGTITQGGTAVSLSGHTHAIADVTGLQGALDGKQAAGSYAPLVSGKVPMANLLVADAAAGGYWNGGAVVVRGDGVAEVGAHLDMHVGNADGLDFAVRLSAIANAGGYKLSIGANALEVGGTQMASLTDLATKMATGNVGATDFNGLTNSGAYRFEVPSANGPGFNYGQLLVVHGAGDTIAQVAFNYSNGDFGWRAGNPAGVGGGGSWSAWDKMSNYVKKADPTFTGSTMWLNTNKALWQHDGTNAYFRSQTGDLHIGAGGNTKLSINGTNGAITAVGPITISVGAANTGLDLASNDAYANLRVMRNANASMPGMWFGYGGAAGNLTFCTNGTATAMILDTSNKLTVNGDIAAIRSGSPTTGVIFLGNSGNTYVYYDGSYYRMPGAELIANGGFVARHLDGSRARFGATISTAGPSGGLNGDVWFKV